MIKYQDKSAQFSADRLYRWELRRRWMSGPEMLIIMLNPSMADAKEDDQTIRRCVGQATRWGYSAIAVRNLFSFIATDPADLWDAHGAGTDIIGADADRNLREICEYHKKILIAWGRLSKPVAIKRADQVLDIMETYGVVGICMGTTSAGYPRHPSRAQYLDQPEIFRRHQ